MSDRPTGGSSGVRTFRVECGEGSYPVHVGLGTFEALPDLVTGSVPAHRYAVLCDDNVDRILGARLVDGLRGMAAEVIRLTFPAGEASKNRHEWARLTDSLLDAGLARDGAVIALGGGVTGDLAGFVAATFMRGVPLVYVPTSLLAMVDASIGGKTGLDTTHGKNLVGAFHPPRMVVTDPRLAVTLSREQRAEGLVEAVKHGAILDDGYLTHIEENIEATLGADVDALGAAVEGSVAIKTRVVSQDEREQGLRSVLNFGHTLGHAIEAASDFGLSHGAAVALGMVLEARLGEHLGVTESGTGDRLAGIVRRLGMRDRLPEAVEPEAVVTFTGSDKKARRGAPRYVLLERLGAIAAGEGWVHPVPLDVVRTVLREHVEAD
jgi:3-dehydroquinate synthase